MDTKFSQSSESELLENAINNPNAFEVILTNYERRIFSYIFNLVGQRQDAEDLTQETFIKVFKNLKLVNPKLSFKGWVYKIATNTVYDWFRRKKARLELFIIDDPESDFETIDEDSTYTKLETAKDMEAALGKIKIVYRTVLLLYYWRGLTYEEVAVALSVPVNTIKTYLRRAKQELKEVLRDAYQTN